MVDQEKIEQARKELQRAIDFERNSFSVNLFRNTAGRRKTKDFTLQVAGTKQFKDIPKEKAFELRKEFGLRPIRQSGFDLGFRGLVPKKRIKGLL